MSLGSRIFGQLVGIIRQHGLDGQRWSLFTAGIGVLVGSIAIIWLRLVPPKIVGDSASAARPEM
jgi:hypothetical protein